MSSGPCRVELNSTNQLCDILLQPLKLSNDNGPKQAVISVVHSLVRLAMIWNTDKSSAAKSTVNTIAFAIGGIKACLRGLHTCVELNLSSEPRLIKSSLDSEAKQSGRFGSSPSVKAKATQYSGLMW